MTQQTQATRSFIEAINRHDVPGILALMSEDHLFIDAYGNRQTKEEMTEGWPGYFAWFPDYHIEITDWMETEDAVGVFGHASGTYGPGPGPETGRNFHIPAAWKVIVADGKVKLWQVFADTKIPYDIMNQADKNRVNQLKNNSDNG